jgi:hypothetical protein
VPGGWLFLGKGALCRMRGSGPTSSGSTSKGEGIAATGEAEIPFAGTVNPAQVGQST